MSTETHILPTLAHRLFSPPYLPRKYTLFSALFVIAGILLVLIRQPGKYWVSYKLAEGEWISPLLPYFCANRRHFYSVTQTGAISTRKRPHQ